MTRAANVSPRPSPKRRNALGETPAAIYMGDEGHGAADLAGILKPGDTLILPQLADLGASIADLAANIKALGHRGVRVYAIRGSGGDLDIVPEVADTLLRIVALWGEADRAIRSRRMRQVAQSRKQQGLAYCRPPMGKRIIERDGARLLVWDQAELRRIAEVARRLPVEGAENLARDFWRREIRDSRGRLWGKQKPKPFSRHRTPFQSFVRAHRQFWRWYWAGELPEPYAALAETMVEPKGFGKEPRPKGWTRGGTARREQERAERKIRRKASGTLDRGDAR